MSIFDSTELINIEVEKMVQSLSYKNLNAYLEEFISITSIEPFDESLINQLIERKATRNLLIHNDLIFNGIYDEAAGPLKRSPNYNGYLSFDLLYINETVHYIEQVFIHIEKSLTNRFSQYTKVNALKNLWNYLFHSPVLRFDDYWEYDDQRIISLKKNHVKRMLDNLSSSERKLLAIWLIHFNPQLCSIFVPEDHSIYTSSLKQSEKLKYLTSLIINDPDLFKLH